MKLYQLGYTLVFQVEYMILYIAFTYSLKNNRFRSDEHPK